MFKTEDAHFGGDYFFEKQELSTTEAVSEAFNLGQTNGGVRVRAWIDGTASASEGNTVTATLETSNDGVSWGALDTAILTAEGTTLTGDIAKFIPDVKDKFMRLKVKAVSGVSGTFSAAPEYIPR